MAGGVLVLVGPSGGGKTTLQDALAAAHPGRVGRAVSYTTRAARADEVNGAAYHFVPDEAFDALAATGAFLEHAEYNGRRYGSTGRQVRAIVDRGQVCVQVVERRGCDAYRAAAAAGAFGPDTPVAFCFVTAPEEALRARIGADRPDVDARMADVAAMTAYAQQTPFDLEVVNVDRDAAVAQMVAFFAERFGP